MENKPRYAGFWIRGVAWLIDTALLVGSNWLIELTLGGLVYWVLRWRAPDFIHARTMDQYMDSADAMWLQIIIFAEYIIVDFLYYTLGHWKYGQTIGKWIVGLRVESSSYAGLPIGRITYAQAVGRWFASLASEVMFGCGYFMVMMHPKKRSLHDLVARTVVVRERPFARPGT